jgi:putative tricarboxylic transport membrane protein
MNLADLIGGVFVTLLGAGILLFSRDLHYHVENIPGPGFLPLWLGIGFLVSGMMTTVKALRRDGSKKEAFFQPKTRYVVYLLISLVITFLFVPVLGLTLCLALFTGFTMRLMGRHSWGLCLVLVGITGLGIRLVFGHWLDIPLPKGLVGF